MNNKLAVYTALFGNYDDLIEPKEKYQGCDFICFTDQKQLTSEIWDIRLIDKCDLPPNMMNRKYKILPHMFLSEYEWSLYIDTNIAILDNPIKLAKQYLTKYDFIVPKHFARDCIYEEAKECLIVGKTKYNETRSQISKYKNEGFPANFGLGENNILLRKHKSKNIITLMNNWWNEVNTQTKRDQLSLAYVLWKNEETFHYMTESSREGAGYFEYIFHNEFRSRNLLQKVKDSLRVRLMSKIIPFIINKEL
ncbi:glycosyltransferase domain-containing protein [uncultured Draconibacterium sp.]|uniref:glycosyltransferase domain-containing protein n=1 Tax=uncultured Draconibacterium sp. TaxID=1573823 RepID=UPI002AA7F364|nr:glycosyltransferase domain-containing protein [uncultured Draconibacterium sp.]